MNVTPHRLIFLDFDGVLHSVRSNARLFEHVARLAEMLAPYPAVRIVVSSSWRNAHEEDALQGFLRPLAERMLGVTPKLAGALRQDEIEAWLQDNTERYAAFDPAGVEVGDWVAIDDMPRLFNPGCPWLLATDPLTGMDQKAWAYLQAWLETGRLPAEVATEGELNLKHSFSAVADLSVNYRIYPRSKRLQLFAPHLDTHLLDDMLFRNAAALGVTGLWQDDDQRFMPNRSDWLVTLELPGVRFRLEAIQLAQAVGRQRTLVLQPLRPQEGESS
ncbi:HAD domain-containing protein [Uliginosibacterium paludis]|uniref:HAD domain-containing protein n=1 Tax=Uliginosibacterium paludis TaxID=1615952 RepID=A0ABV2CKX4_9RHOO